MWYETFKLGLATLFTGLAIKLSDDFIDRQEDAAIGKQTLGTTLGDGTFPLAILCILLACHFSVLLGISLYLAGYGIGMVKDPQVKYLTGFTGWQEIGLIFILSNFFVGLRQTMLAWMLLFAIQCIDDLVDYPRDTVNTNLVVRFGVVETAILMLVAIAIAYGISPRQTLLVLGSFILIELLWVKVAGGIGVQSWKT